MLEFFIFSTEVSGVNIVPPTANNTIGRSGSVGSIIISPNNPEVLSDDSLSSVATIPIVDAKDKVLKVHRMQLKDDMIKEFRKITNENITFEVIDSRGRIEPGEGIGTSRDIYASLWQELMDSVFIGEGERVPLVRHDLFLDEWTAIGRILQIGFEQTAYFPIQIAKAFIIYCLFGSVPEPMLVQSFLNFLPEVDKQVVDVALKCQNNSIYESDELLDILERFNCRKKVCALNIYGTIVEIARQEIIQKPYIMVCSWKEPLLKLQLSCHFRDIESVINFYRLSQPTTKTVLKLLSAEPHTDGEWDALKFFTQYVKGLDQNHLKLLLKFITGSDIILTKKIKITFNALDGVERRPFARTCSPLLELPSTYRNYCQLREEFKNVLSLEKIWGTDTV